MTASPCGTVLVVTTTIDLAADRVVDKLQQNGIPVFRLNTDRLPYDAEISISHSLAAETDRFRLREVGRTVTDRSIAAYWYRRVRMPPRPTDVSSESHEYVFREAIAALRGALEVLQLRVRSFGSPTVLERAESKVLQLDLAVSLGFEVPITLITSNPTEMRGFASEHPGGVVAKPIHSGYMRTSGGDVGVFTERLAEHDLDDVEGALPCPIILQAEIPKAYDIRATVVRNQVFVAAIDSQSDPAARVDWRRTSRPDLPHSRHELPRSLRDGCVALASTLGTGFAAVDFVLRPDGRYVFLEANPNGEWLWIEDALRYPISDAIVRYLANGQ